MAIDRFARYPGRFDPPTSASPQGAFKNRTAPGAKDGSYLERDWANDWDGFFGSLLRSAGMTPDGTPDTALSSQYFSAMNSVVGTAISLAILDKITGENCRNAGLTAGGTIPYMQRLSDGAVIQLATKTNAALDGIPTAPTAPVGTWNNQIASTAFVNESISARPSIGISQTWQDVTASRAKGVTYTNGTGRPIQIFINFDPDGGSSVLRIAGHPFNVNDNSSEFVSAIIPAGNTYSLSAWGTANTMKWLELR